MAAKVIKGTLSVDERLERIEAAIRAVDARHKPDFSSYKKNKPAFVKKWGQYEKEIKKAARACIEEMGVSNDVTGIYDDVITPETATDYLSRARKRIRQNLNFIAPHYTDTLNGLIKKNRRFKAELSRLHLKDSDRISETISMIKGKMMDDDGHPLDLVKQIKDLPFQHPAIRYLKLPKEIREDIKEYRENVLTIKQENVVTLPYSFVQRYCEAVYDSRKDQHWTSLFFCLAFCTGRREFELCGISNFAKGPRDYTLEVKALGKKKPNVDGTRPAHSYEIPVVILTPKQCLELIKLLRSRLDEAFPGIDLTVSGSFNRNLAKPLQRAFDDFKSTSPVPLVEKKDEDKDLQSHEQKTPEQIAKEKKRRNIFTIHNITRSAYAHMAFKLRRDFSPGKSILLFTKDVLKHAQRTKTPTYLCVEVDLDDTARPAAGAPKADKSLLLPQLEDSKLMSFLMDYDMANLGAGTMLVHAKILNHLKRTGSIPSRSEVEQHMRGKEHIEHYLKLLKRKKVELNGF